MSLRRFEEAGTGKRALLQEAALVSLCILEQLTSSFTTQRAFFPFMF